MTPEAASVPRPAGGSRETDPFLRRLERDALLWCAAMTVVALLVTGDWSMALGVAGGGALAAVSLFAIRSSVDALLALMAPSPSPMAGAVVAGADRPTGADADDAPPGDDAVPDHEGGDDSRSRADAAPSRRRVAAALVRLVGRYALLALMAYAMIARLRLHPIGLLIGASSLVASAALEAARVLTRARVS